MAVAAQANKTARIAWAVLLEQLRSGILHIDAVIRLADRPPTDADADAHERVADAAERG